jgi:hypothetical protein
VLVDWRHQSFFSFKFPSTKNKKRIDAKQGPLVVENKKRTTIVVQQQKPRRGPRQKHKCVDTCNAKFGHFRLTIFIFQYNHEIQCTMSHGPTNESQSNVLIR